MTRPLRLTVMVLFLPLAGCFQPSYQNGNLQCDDVGRCPSGLHCTAGRCYLPGQDPDLALAAMPDLPSSPDMLMPTVVAEPVWIGAGGSAIGAMGQINVSVGGFDTVGTSNSDGGHAQFTAGLFASQSNPP